MTEPEHARYTNKVIEVMKDVGIMVTFYDTRWVVGASPEDYHTMVKGDPSKDPMYHTRRYRGNALFKAVCGQLSVYLYVAGENDDKLRFEIRAPGVVVKLDHVDNSVLIDMLVRITDSARKQAEQLGRMAKGFFIG